MNTMIIFLHMHAMVKGFIEGRAAGKLTGCERDLPGLFRLLFLLSFIRKTKNAKLKNLTDPLHKKLMKPLHGQVTLIVH